MADALGMQLNGGFLQSISGNASQAQIIQVMNDIVNTLNNQLQSSTSSDGTNKRYLNGYQQNGWPGGSFGMKISKPGFDVTTATYSQLLFYWDYTTNIQYYNDSITGVTYTTIGSTGIRVAKSGIDVTTATNDQLIFNSAQNIFKIVATGTLSTGTVATGGSAVRASVNTGIPSTTALAFTSFMQLTGTGTGTNYQMPYVGYVQNPGTFGANVLESYTAGTFVSGGTVWFYVDCLNYSLSSNSPRNIKYYIFQETGV